LKLLNLESSMAVIEEALRQHRSEYGFTLIPEFLDRSEEIRGLVLDSSGNCRLLELIFKSLQQEDCMDVYLFRDIDRSYNICNGPLAGAVAYALLGLPVSENDSIPGDESYTFLKLVELGLIKIERDIVIMPMLFIKCFFNGVSKQKVYFASFWTFSSTCWEEYCVLHIALRLAMCS
jgi:hypothetical protein